LIFAFLPTVSAERRGRTREIDLSKPRTLRIGLDGTGLADSRRPGSMVAPGATQPICARPGQAILATNRVCGRSVPDCLRRPGTRSRRAQVRLRSAAGAHANQRGRATLGVKNLLVAERSIGSFRQAQKYKLRRSAHVPA